ncbi:MAG: DUF2088 domain-containing protein [Anaerolineales bacterium]|nr:MAG: DUF2088 domain-containing protein [Anaerolineales bacterium]
MCPRGRYRDQVSRLIGRGSVGSALTEAEVHSLIARAFARHDVTNRRVLFIVPDATRSAPMSMMFRLFHEVVGEEVAALDYLIALGTHRPMSESQINSLLGLTPEERAGTFGAIRIHNHEWDKPETFEKIGTIPSGEVETISEGVLRLDIPVMINRRLFDYDRVIICGPTFPHEVVGFSGGNKYLVPGVAGPNVIDITHWLGALITSREIAGTKHTPVRALIDRAASLIEVPKLCFSLVVRGHDDLMGLYIGTPEEAFEAAADLSAKHHIVYVSKPLKRVLSVMPKMYEDLWTAAKGMYKLEPAIADGGEVVIFAPHINELSYTHGKVINEIGYHVRDYYLRQWNRFKEYPWCVLAHSTHLRGAGTFENGIEEPRIRVTLSTGIPRERCERIGLGYLDPATVDIDAWCGREDEGIMVIPRAGEKLYRVSE